MSKDQARHTTGPWLTHVDLSEMSPWNGREGLGCDVVLRSGAPPCLLGSGGSEDPLGVFGRGAAGAEGSLEQREWGGPEVGASRGEQEWLLESDRVMHAPEKGEEAE